MLQELNVYEALRSPPESPAWQEAELTVIANCFSLGYMRRVTRGFDRNQIQTRSPTAGPRPSGLEDGLFEAHVRAHAFRAYRDVNPHTDGVWSAFFAFSGLRELEDSALWSSAAAIGKWLGITIAFWNRLGKAWKDFLDLFGDDPRSNGFLVFYEKGRSIRSTIDQTVTPGDLLRRFLETTRTQQQKPRVSFEPGSVEYEVLVAAGVGVDSIERLPQTFKKWELSRQVWVAWFRSITEDHGAHDQRSSDPLDNFFGALESVDERKQIGRLFNAAKGLFYLNGGSFSWNQPGLNGLFQVVVNVDSEGKLGLSPQISTGSPGLIGSRGILVLFHEIGHSILHARWQAELALMWFVFERFRSRGCP